MSERRKVLEKFEEQYEYMQERVNSGIEEYRKGDFTITVTDADGKGIDNVKIRVNQKSHEFKFGANLFMLDELETKEKNELYKKYFADVFNMATLPFYWDATEPEQGKTRYDKDSPKVYRRPSADLCIEFCEKHGIEPREHGLAYNGFFPKWLYNASLEEEKEALEKRFGEISKRYKDKIPTIEVTNEMGWGKGKTAFYDEPNFVEWCFKMAEKYFPENHLVINDATEQTWGDACRATSMYYAYTEANLLKGARIDSIGMQFHMFYKSEEEYKKTRVFYDPENLYGHMDLYSNLVKSLQVTEVTIPAYSNDTEDEAIQAEIIEKLYSIWFSHPYMEQIVYWNLVDGYAHLWDPDPEKIKASQGDMTLGENYYYGGLLRFDLSPKPAYFTIKNLIEKKWHTEAETVTNHLGKADFRGFYGKYDVEIEANGKRMIKEISISKNHENDFEYVI